MKKGMTGSKYLLHLDQKEKVNVVRSLRVIRWRFRRIYAGVRFGEKTLEGSPVIFGNSFPKSGTHLLAQILSAFPKIGVAVDRGMGPVLTFDRSTGRQRSSREVLADLNRLQPGDLAFGHVTAEPEIVEGWRHDQIIHFFMIRDPRDVVVSHAFYIGDKAIQNVHHTYYKSLPDLDSRLRTSILGRPDWEGDFPDIGKRFSAYLGWLDCPWVTILRFEDYVKDRDKAITQLVEFSEERGYHRIVGCQQAIEILTRAIDPSHSFTFRSGKVGDWQKHFTEEHKRMFKDVAGDLLIHLGYERDFTW